MNYEKLKIPTEIDKAFNKMTLKEVDLYLEWFLNIRNTRLNYLVKTVFKTDVLEFTPANMIKLQRFLKENITVRLKSSKEIDLILKNYHIKIRNSVQVPNYELIEPTISMIVDVGIYFSEYLRHEVQGIEWASEKEPTIAYYRCPILVKEGILSVFCPSWTMNILVGKIYKNVAKEDEMLSLYETWRNNFNGTPIDYVALVNSWRKKKK